MKTQLLVCRAVPFELDRAKGDGDGFTMEGYGAVFDTPTRIDSWEGLFDEVIARGAFTKTLAERKPVLQFDHGRDVATGSVPIGAIEDIREDRHGLFVRARLHDNARVEPIRQAIASGAIDGMSFRFQIVREEVDDSGDIELRTVREVKLFEVGPVVFPAYEATSVGVRSLLADLDDADRRRLLTDLRGTLTPFATGGLVSSSAASFTIGEFLVPPADAAREGTSAGQSPDAAQEGTSGSKPGERREELFPFLSRKDQAA